MSHGTVAFDNRSHFLGKAGILVIRLEARLQDFRDFTKIVKLNTRIS